MPAPGGDAWTPEAVGRLRKLWGEGKSASDIANTLAKEELGFWTRNAVIGKVHRLGLAGRFSPSRPVKRVPQQRPPRRMMAVPSPPRTLRAPRELPRPETLEPLRDENGRAIAPSVLELRPGQCKWPIGDPLTSDFGFCAREASAECDGDPYCASHRAMARIQYPTDPKKLAGVAP